MIYFAQAEGTDRVKIGFTAGDPGKRVSDLQTGCPHRLVLLATIVGTEQDEARWHEQFASDRVGGEWFRMSWRLCLAIARAELSATKWMLESFTHPRVCDLEDAVKGLQAGLRRVTPLTILWEIYGESASDSSGGDFVFYAISDDPLAPPDPHAAFQVIGPTNHSLYEVHHVKRVDRIDLNKTSIDRVYDCRTREGISFDVTASLLEANS